MSYVVRIRVARMLLLLALATLALAGRAVYAAPAPQGGSTVNIVDFAFEPAELTVPAGSSVTWTNTGQRPHTATANNAAFDSGNLDGGASFSFTFNQAGSYAYICEYHPNMTGTITVAAASSAPSTMPNTGVSDQTLLLVLLALIALAAGFGLSRNARRRATH